MEIHLNKHINLTTSEAYFSGPLRGHRQGGLRAVNTRFCAVFGVASGSNTGAKIIDWCRFLDQTCGRHPNVSQINYLVWMLMLKHVEICIFVLRRL